MTHPAKSLAAFGAYTAVLGALLVLSPNLVLTTFGLEPTTEVYIRVVGVLVLMLAFYYVEAARHEVTALFLASIYARTAVLLFFIGFVAFDLARPVLILFGMVDAAGALWTAMAMRRAAATAHTEP